MFFGCSSDFQCGDLVNFIADGRSTSKRRVADSGIVVGLKDNGNVLKVCTGRDDEQSKFRRGELLHQQACLKAWNTASAVRRSAVERPHQTVEEETRKRRKRIRLLATLHTHPCRSRDLLVSKA